MLRAAALISLAGLAAAADRLDHLRAEARHQSSPSSTSSTSTSARRDDESPAVDLLGLIFGSSSDDACHDRPAPRHRSLADPPELRGLPPPPRPADESPLDVYAAAEAGTQEGVSRFGARLGFLTAHGGMSVGDDRFYEHRDPGRGWDRLDLARLDGELTATSAAGVSLRFGLVGYLLHDPHGNDGGIAALGELRCLDLFAVPRLDCAARCELGVLGSAGLVRLRGELGYRLGALEPMVGYDYLRVGGAALQGPFAGLVVHF